SRRLDGPDVPVTLLLGRGWRAATRSVRALTARLARRLGHAVDACDLEASGAPFEDVVRAVVERGTARLVLLPLTLDGERAWTRPLDEAVATARGAWPFLRVHRGMPPATHDVARMLGDRARDALGALSSAPGGVARGDSGRGP